MEDEFSILLSACVDPKRAEASGIWAKTLRALDPSKGKNDKDSRARQRKKEKLLACILAGDEIPEEGIYPGLEERWGRARPDQRALVIPARCFERLAEKIVRGLAYLEEGVLIGPDYVVEHHPLTSKGVLPIEDVLAKYGVERHGGPGVQIVRAVAGEDPVASLSKITIWGEFVLYVSVSPHDAQQVTAGDRSSGT